MSLLLTIALLAYGVLNLVFAFKKDVPKNLQFLLGGKILAIFIFIPEKYRVPGTRLIMGIACLLIAAYMIQVQFIRMA